jgi:hypothetical protein
LLSLVALPGIVWVGTPVIGGGRDVPTRIGAEWLEAPDGCRGPKLGRRSAVGSHAAQAGDQGSPRALRPPGTATQPSTLPAADLDTAPRPGEGHYLPTQDPEEPIKLAAAKGEMSVSEFMRAATLMMMVLDGNAHAMRTLGRGALRFTVDVWERIRGVVTGMDGYRSTAARQSRADRVGA